MAGQTFSETPLFGMTIRESATDGSDFTNPAADYRRLFLGEDGLLHVKDSAGAVTNVSGLANPMTTAGDLIRGGAAGVPTRLAIGAAGTRPYSDGTAISWVGFVGCRATANAATSIVNATYTSIAFATESFDTHAFHDTSTNNSRLTIPSGWGGKYLIVGTGAFAAAAGGKRGVKILLNGATIVDLHVVDATQIGTFSPRLPVTSIYALAAGDYVELQLFQDTGGNINSTTESTFALTFLGA